MGNVLRVGIAVWIVGCGHGASSQSADGGIATSGDGSIATGGDGSVPVNRGTVHVTVLDPAGTGAPAAGVPVVYVDPDGTVVAGIDTDINGKSQADLLPSGSVTTVELMPQRHFVQLRTTLGVEPGDDLVIGSVSPLVSAANFTVQWPAAPGNPTSYSVYGPCGLAGFTDGQTQSLTFSVMTACEHDTMEILVAARDRADNTIGFDDAAAIPFVADGSAMLPDAWSSGMGFRASYTNLAGVNDIDFERLVTEGEGFLSFGFGNANGGPSVTFVLTVPTLATGRMHSSFIGSAAGTQDVWQTIAGDAPTYELDGASTLLAWLTRPQPDASGQRFHIGKITADTSSAAADLLELDLSWSHAGTFYMWSVFGPDADDIQLPALPSSLGADLNPTPGDAVTAKAILYEADTLAGYGAVRANIDEVLGEAFQDMRRSHAQLVRVSSSL